MRFTHLPGGARAALTSHGMTLDLQRNHQAGLIRIGVRRASLRVAFHVTVDEALALAAELMNEAARIGPDANLRPTLPEVADSDFGAFLDAGGKAN